MNVYIWMNNRCVCVCVCVCVCINISTHSVLFIAKNIYSYNGEIILIIIYFNNMSLNTCLIKQSKIIEDT